MRRFTVHFAGSVFVGATVCFVIIVVCAWTGGPEWLALAVGGVLGFISIIWAERLGGGDS